MSETLAKRPNVALFVDLDGTLINSDMLWEAFFRAVKQEPWIIFLAPFWLLRGRASLKQQIAQRAAPDPESLPYRQDVIDYIRLRKDEGLRVVLATASHERWAQPVADKLGLFDDVIATHGATNLKGGRKLEAIARYCDSHDIERWGYIGDATVDLPIWDKADEVLVVAPSSSLLAKVQAKRPPDHVFGKRPSKLAPALKAMRPHQWVKNLLLFAPLMLAREFTDPGKTFAAIVAFACFSLCASSVYLVNDLLDIEADRLHHRKRHRPFAAGTLPIHYGPPMALAVVLTAFGLAIALLPTAYVGVLIFYMFVTSAYSASLKSKLLVDVLILASLYTLRIFAGGVATGLEVSEWLLAFSIFIFTSLAFAKRYVEMQKLLADGKTTAKGRGYEVGDISLIESFGATSGYLAVLVFALYVNNGLPSFYRETWLLWLSCPFMLFWISRLWFLAKRGELNDDPVVFAVTDKVSLAIGVVVATLVLLAGSSWVSGLGDVLFTH